MVETYVVNLLSTLKCFISFAIHFSYLFFSSFFRGIDIEERKSLRMNLNC